MSQNLISPLELKELIESNTPFALVDVREESECNIAQIDSENHIPLENIKINYEELNQDQDIIIYCHSGVESFQVCRLLEMLGFVRVRSLVGGINAWHQEIDSTIK